MSNYTTANFKLGSCIISFKGTVLGGTDGGPKFTVEPEFYESKCDQAGGIPVRKLVTNMKISLTAALKEIDAGFAQILNESGKITTASIGADLLTGGGALVLTPIESTDDYGYSFPNAVLLPKLEYSYNGTEDHVLPVEFDILPDDEGVYLERVAISAS